MYEQPETVTDTDCICTCRLTMRLLLAAVLLLFGALLVGQLALRFVSPGLFAWGAHFLPAGHGLANTAVLILSCLPIAIAGRMITPANRWPMIAALSATFVAGVIFLAVQSIEYERSFRYGLGWGTPASGAVVGAAGVTGELGAGDAGAGAGFWQATCRACHGAGGEGVEGQGKDLRQSTFVKELDDPGLLAFIRTGRLVSDPLNTTGMPMPPKGGNPMLKDPQLMDIVAHIRSIQVPISEESSPDLGDATTLPDADVPAVDDEDGANLVKADPPQAVESGDEFWIPSSSVPRATLGPIGLSADAFARADRPVRADLFFGFFFLMTGLHVVQVVIGLLMLAWLIFRAIQVRYRPEDEVSLDLARRYWFCTVAIWGVLLPMFYFIG